MNKSIILGLLIVFLTSALLAVPEHNPGNVIVKFRSDLRGEQILSLSGNQVVSAYPGLNKILSEYNFIQYHQLIPEYDHSRNVDYQLDLIYVLHSAHDQSAVNSISQLNASPWVEYAELDLKLKFERITINPWQPLLTPNDPYYSSQWFLPNINATQAWDIQTGNHSHICAIVDDGCEKDHADLTGNYVNGYDYVDNDNDPTPPSSGDNHGTHCSGLAAARSNNSIGIASIGFNIGLMGVRSYYISEAVQGIYFASQNGADAISMSWTCGTSPNSSVQNAINDAYNNYDVVCLAAAGNYNTSTTYYPAAGSNCVAVAATASNNQKASFSNYGTWIDISAPGVNMYSTVPYGSYQYMDGTSMSTPLTAGLVTLIRCEFPGESNAQIIQRLYNSADAMSSCYYYNQGWMGAGKINAYAALQGGSPDTSITVTSPNGGETWYVGSSHSISWTDNNVSSFDVHYSTNNGSTWTQLTSNTGSNAYSWTIPNTPSSQCLVRVRDHSHPSSIYDLSDAVFTIDTTSTGSCDTVTYWDWGVVETRFNYGDPPEWMGMGARFTPTELSPHSGKYIEQIIFQLGAGNNPANDAKFYIFGDSTSTNPGDTLVEMSFTVTGDSQWYVFDLGTNHVPVNASGDMWLLVGFTYESGVFPFPANTGSYYSGKSDWAWTNTGGWEKLGDYGFYDGWPVGAVVCNQQGIAEEIGTNLSSNLVLQASPVSGINNYQINFSIPVDGNISLKLYDLVGREQLNIAEGWFNSGTHQVNVDGSKLTSGSYFLRLSTTYGSTVYKLAVTK
ncbi:MAG: hypothetical protein APR63_14385 [Desulfuromonas sp. SDB]|nr:MAG: hypothetical protein APR63_14385 [Desulfuromonas sp. SDB]